jgi:hypothetical protein
MAQQKITGTVKSGDSVVIGASVQVKDTTNSTLTDSAANDLKMLTVYLQ